MSGLIGESPKGIGYRNFFEQMWRKILDDLKVAKHPKANSNNKIVSAIYDLRCEYGTNHTVHKKVMRLKKIGDDYIPGVFDPKSLGFSVNFFLKKFLIQSYQMLSSLRS